MKTDKFILIRVKEDYIEHLRNYDNKVQINSNKYEKDNKPFLGVLFNINDIEYFVPISSNRKEKLQKMFDTYVATNNKPIDMFFIEELKNGKRNLLSVLNINNMIPIVEDAKIYFDIRGDKDFSLLRKEIDFCNKHKDEITKNSLRIHKAVTSHTWASLEKRCCDFELLEEKCKEYNKNKERNINSNDSKQKDLFEDIDILDNF